MFEVATWTAARAPSIDGFLQDSLNLGQIYCWHKFEVGLDKKAVD